MARQLMGEVKVVVETAILLTEHRLVCQMLPVLDGNPFIVACSLAIWKEIYMT